ncbi:MAG: hypothetical protein MGAcid_20700 [uncultured Acidilobus sp. MG]|nr:MAG: hypothetical protein MGAcid_20700 [uncultured Acidilobus sp. MG]
MRAKARALAVVAALLIAASLAAAYADVIYLYTARVALAPVQSPVAFNRLVYWCPLSPRINVVNYGSWQNSSGYAFTLYNVTASGSQYLVRWPFTVFNLSQAGTVTVRLNGSSASFQMSAGSYSIYLILSGPLASPLYLSGNLSFEPSSSPGIFYIYRETVTLLPPPLNVLSFVDNKSYQVSPLVYQGDIDSTPVKNVIKSPPNPTYWWPSDISGALAQLYWSWWYPNAAYQPVMNMTGYFWDYLYYYPYYGVIYPTAGAVFWSYGYTGGSNITIAAIITYSNDTLTGRLGHGVTFYFFINPYGWSVSNTSNQSVLYVTSLNVSQYLSPVMGDVIFPNSSTPPNYLAVQFDPAWFYNYNYYTGATGPWNAWVVNETYVHHRRFRYYSTSFAPSPSPNLGPPWSGWDGVGTWSPYPWLPGPGDYVLVCVTYSPSTNSLYGFAEDLNYPWLISSFAVNLSGYFGPPSSGTYAFGVGAGTGSTYAADWSIVYVWEGS